MIIIPFNTFFLFPPTPPPANFLSTLLLRSLSSFVDSLLSYFLSSLLSSLFSCIRSSSLACLFYFRWFFSWSILFFFVFLGAHYRVGHPTSVQETINVTQVIYHREFSWITAKNDVALLKLAKPITPSDKVNTVCLPENGTNQISPGTNCFITGKVVMALFMNIMYMSKSCLNFAL